MDFLNQALAQVNNLFRSMSMGARIVAGLLLAVIVVSLAYLFNHQMAGPDAYLLGGEAIDATEINAVTSALGQAGLTSFQVDGNRIRVPRGEEATYMAALAEEGALPGNYGSYLQKAITESGPLVSKAKQNELLKQGLQLELQRVIRKMKGISNASVLISTVEEGNLAKKKVHSASVSVNTIGGVDLEDRVVTAIRHTVAAAISQSMAPESVTVTNVDSGYTYPATRPGETPAGLENPYIKNRLAYEKTWREKIMTALDFIEGVVVTCNVEVDPTVEQLEQKTQHDPKTVAYSVDEVSKTANSQGPQPSGRPGMVAQGGTNQPATIGAAAGGGAKTEEEVSERREKNVVSGSTKEIKTAGLIPTRITAAIGVPSSFLEKVYLERNPPAPGAAVTKPSRVDLKTVEDEYVKKIQEMVATMLDLPKEAAPNPIPNVRVTVFDRLPGETLPEPGMGDHALSWLANHWSTLGTGLLGLVSLVMLRSMVKTAPPQPAFTPPPANTTDQQASQAAEAANEPKPPSLRKRRLRSGPSLREELVEIVRDDPDAAANILRSWINSN